MEKPRCRVVARPPNERTGEVEYKLVPANQVLKLQTRRTRQQDVVDLLTDATRLADAGETVGVVVLKVDKDGVWHHERSMDHSDIPTMLGYIELFKQNAVHKYLTGEALIPSDGD